MSLDDYTIQEHQHRYCSWAASRAASVNRCRFRVAQGKQIIEASGLSAIALPNDLPPVGVIDRQHRYWRNHVIASAKEFDLDFTHGVAAKLINVYLKTRFVCGGHHFHPQVAQLHPPIDAMLLKALSVNDVGGFKQGWDRAITIQWSKFDESDYENVIDLIRQTLGKKPLWIIESYWRGYQ